MKFIVIGLGGALGAVCRYSFSLIPFKYTFPLLTLLINLIGSTVIGFIIGLSMTNKLSPNTILFWQTGVCGGFTTFSTFSAETLGLFQAGKIFQGSVYIILSIGLCLLGVFLGQCLARTVVRQ